MVYLDQMNRYRDIIPDFDDFKDKLEEPLKRTLRVNPIKAKMESVRDELLASGIETIPMNWYEHGLYIEDEKVKLGNTLPNYLGWIHIQEEVSMVPPVVLDPNSTDTVLDICAAPGSKATQIAPMSKMVVANDDDIGRLSILRNNSDKLGVTNLAATSYDGRRMPGRDLFDSALVDVPCTSQGITRKTRNADDNTSMDEIKSISGVQKGILSRAIDLVKPGGEIVYSTCTYAPEENEAVLARVIDDVSIQDFDLQLEHSNGVTEWSGDEYPADVRHAKRIYPHQNDTGGFFVAKLRVES